MLSGAWKVARFDLVNELRSGVGLASLSLFLIGVAAAFVFGSSPDRPSPTVAAGTLTAMSVLTAYLTSARSLLLDVDRGTYETLRSLVDSRSLFLGKLISAVMQALLGVGVVSTIYIAGVGLEVIGGAMLVVTLAALAFSFTVAMMIAALIGAAGHGKWVLVGAAGLPLVLPLVFSGVSAIRPALGFGAPHWQYTAGIFGYGAVFAALGIAVAPHLIRGRDPN